MAIRPAAKGVPRDEPDQLGRSGGHWPCPGGPRGPWRVGRGRVALRVARLWGTRSSATKRAGLAGRKTSRCEKVQADRWARAMGRHRLRGGRGSRATLGEIPDGGGAVPASSSTDRGRFVTRATKGTRRISSSGG